jgi:hypothetical protein
MAAPKHTESMIDLDKMVLNTEAHPLWISQFVDNKDTELMGIY